MVGRQRAKLLTWAVLLAITLLIAGEVAARALRLCDVPLFDADPRIGYIPKANQSGAWRWSNQWAFNALHMGTARPFAPSPTRPDVLLIGDSIVSGGVHYREEQRFGPSLARASGLTVWPVSAPSWGLQNELQYLRDHPAVLRAIDRVVIVSNSGDFARPSSWASEVSHPRTPPVSALFTLVRKLLVNSDKAAQRPPPDALRVPPRDNVADFAAFAAAFPRPVTVVVYPNKAEAPVADPCGYPRPAPYRGFANVRYLCVVSVRSSPPC